jgi:hypothetical protein
MRLATLSRTIATTLAISVVGASAASARYLPEPTPSATDQATTVRQAVSPNPDQQAPSTGHGAPPVASGTPQTAVFNSARPNPAAGGAHPTAAASTPSNGFDWGDAAVGAGVAAAIAALVTAGSLGLRQRSQPRLP